MKIGIISDIHGNIKALEAVLKELEKINVDKIICLGDMIGGVPSSEEVVQRIIKMKDKCICVRGNREKYIIEGMPLIVHDEKMKITQEQLEENEWEKNRLSKKTIEYIHELPKEVFCEIECKKIYCVHYPMNKDGSFKKHIKEANLKENEEMFSDIDADIYLYGHTHKNIYNKGSKKIYINPGALGCPENSQKAPYGILEINNNDIEYKQLEVKYNVKEVIEDIKKIAFPGYNQVLKLFFGMDINQFSRTELLIAKQGIEKLKNAKVAIFGIGGVGSFVVEGLVRAGIGNFVLVDGDKVSLTNLNRQIIATRKTIGRPKVEVAKERILEINPNANVEIYQEFFMPQSDGILDDTIDYIVDCVDTVTAKIELVLKANKLNIPIVSSMGTGNKLDPTKFEVTDIYKTSVCPLAKVMRKELKARGIKGLKVVYSKEEPIKINQNDVLEEKCKAGSISFVPSVAGLIIAGEVVKDIIAIN